LLQNILRISAVVGRSANYIRRSRFLLRWKSAEQRSTLWGVDETELAHKSSAWCGDNIKAMDSTLMQSIIANTGVWAWDAASQRMRRLGTFSI
jgi:hypothetical protein